MANCPIYDFLGGGGLSAPLDPGCESQIPVLIGLKTSQFLNWYHHLFIKIFQLVDGRSKCQVSER